MKMNKEFTSQKKGKVDIMTKILITVLMAAFSTITLKLLIQSYEFISFIVKYKILKKEYVPCQEMKDNYIIE